MLKLWSASAAWWRIVGPAHVAAPRRQPWETPCEAWASCVPIPKKARQPLLWPWLLLSCSSGTLCRAVPKHAGPAQAQAARSALRISMGATCQGLWQHFQDSVHQLEAGRGTRSCTNKHMQHACQLPRPTQHPTHGIPHTAPHSAQTRSHMLPAGA